MPLTVTYGNEVFINSINYTKNYCQDHQIFLYNSCLGGSVMLTTIMKKKRLNHLNNVGYINGSSQSYKQ